MKTSFLRVTELPKRTLLGAIEIYRLTLSPFLGQSCRFQPSCSEYAMTAVGQFGAVKGTFLAVLRICRCHPWHPGGYDPVPSLSTPSPEAAIRHPD